MKKIKISHVILISFIIFYIFSIYFVMILSEMLESFFDVKRADDIRLQLLNCDKNFLKNEYKNCILSIKGGEIEVKRDGIYYTLVTDSNICHPHDWLLLDVNGMVWEKCYYISDYYIYELKWIYNENIIIIYKNDEEINISNSTSKRFKNAIFEITRNVIKDDVSILNIILSINK